MTIADNFVKYIRNGDKTLIEQYALEELKCAKYESDRLRVVKFILPGNLKNDDVVVSLKKKMKNKISVQPTLKMSGL